MPRRLPPVLLCASLAAALSLCLALNAGCDDKSSSPNSTTGDGRRGDKLRIAVIPKGTTHEFWKSVEAGARAAGSELGVEIIWKGPLREDEMADQIAMVEQFVSEGVSAIVVAPLDSGGLVRPVKAAGTRKIPVVIFDSALEAEAGKDFVAFVGTNNHNAGKMAGEELVRLLGGKGKAVMIRYKAGSASTMEREAGFLEAMKANPGIELISTDQEAGATVDTAKAQSQNMLDTLRRADGLFCPNESSTLGTLLTLRQAGLTKGEGRKVFVGFDATPPLVSAIEAGELDAAVAQNPIKMGYDAVVAAVSHVKGQTVRQNQDTGAVLVTKAKLDDPEVKALLKR
jgi:ribose transport system substrate-binding protein